MSDKLKFDDEGSGGNYEPTDSEEEYSEEERELLQKVRQRNQRKQDSKQEVLAFDSSDDEDDESDDVAELMRDSDIEGAGDDDFDLPDRKAWGSKASKFYNTDFVDPDYSTFTDKDRELALLEEEEAIATQLRMASHIREENFHFEDLFINPDNSTTTDSSDDEEMKVPAKKTKVAEKKIKKNGIEDDNNKDSGLKKTKLIAMDTSDCSDNMLEISAKQTSKGDSKRRSKDEKNKKPSLNATKSEAIDTSDDENVIHIPVVEKHKALLLDTTDDEDIQVPPQKSKVRLKKHTKVESGENTSSPLKPRKSLALDKSNSDDADSNSDDDEKKSKKSKRHSKKDSQIGMKCEKNTTSPNKQRKSVILDNSDNDDDNDRPKSGTENDTSDTDDGIKIPGMKVSTKPHKLATRRAPDETEVSVNLAGLSKKEQLQLFQEDSPEFLGLVTDMFKTIDECDSVLLPVLNNAKRLKLPPIPALKFAELLSNLMITYCCNINFYLMLKSQRISIRTHPVVNRLLQLKNMIERLSGRYEETVKPQLEALLKRIEEGDDIKIIVPEEGHKKQPPKQQTKIRKATRESPNIEGDMEISSVDSNIMKAYCSEDDDDADEDDVDDLDEDKDADAVEEEECVNEEDDRRGITYQMAKNKGLTPHRKKELRNPRVKHRSKFRKALIRRKGAVRTVRKETKRYGGEISGIKATVSKSVKFK